MLPLEKLQAQAQGGGLLPQGAGLLPQEVTQTRMGISLSLTGLVGGLWLSR